MLFYIQGLHPGLNDSKILYPDLDFGSFEEKYGAWTSMFVVFVHYVTFTNIISEF